VLISDHGLLSRGVARVYVASSGQNHVASVECGFPFVSVVRWSACVRYHKNDGTGAFGSALSWSCALLFANSSSSAFVAVVACCGAWVIGVYWVWAWPGYARCRFAGFSLLVRSRRICSYHAGVMVVDMVGGLRGASCSRLVHECSC
jgi:hypothetical protein